MSDRTLPATIALATDNKAYTRAPFGDYLPPVREFTETKYIDPDAGNDSADGSQGTPWKTLLLSAPKFIAGGKYILKKSARGPIRDHMNSTISGTAAQPILLCGEDPLDRPVLTGGELSDPASTAWTDNGDGRWYLARTSKTFVAIEDETLHLEYASSDALTDGNYFDDSQGAGFLWYKPTSGTAADHSLRYSASSGFINIQSSYMQVEDIDIWCTNGWASKIGQEARTPQINFSSMKRMDCTHTGGMAIAAWNCKDSVFEDITTSYAENGIYLNENCDRNFINRHTAQYNGMPKYGHMAGDRGGIAVGGRTDTAYFRYANVIYDSVSENNGGITTTVDSYDSDHAIVAWCAPGTIIIGCTSRYNYSGGVALGINAPGSILEDTLIEDNALENQALPTPTAGVSGGLLINKSSNVRVLNNTVTGNASTDGSPYDGGSVVPVGAGCHIRDTNGYYDNSNPIEFTGNVFSYNYNGDAVLANYVLASSASDQVPVFDPDFASQFETEA